MLIEILIFSDFFDDFGSFLHIFHEKFRRDMDQNVNKPKAHVINLNDLDHSLAKFPCTSCPSVFNTLPSMKKHQWMVHEINVIDLDGFKCRFCVKSFETVNKLKEHIANNHTLNQSLIEKPKKPKKYFYYAKPLPQNEIVENVAEEILQSAKGTVWKFKHFNATFISREIKCDEF